MTRSMMPGVLAYCFSVQLQTLVSALCSGSHGLSSQSTHMATLLRGMGILTASYVVKFWCSLVR
jgi:hypothetical protein